MNLRPSYGSRFIAVGGGAKKIRKNTPTDEKKRNILRNYDLVRIHVPWVGGGGWRYEKENPKKQRREGGGGIGGTNNLQAR